MNPTTPTTPPQVTEEEAFRLHCLDVAIRNTLSRPETIAYLSSVFTTEYAKAMSLVPTKKQAKTITITKTATKMRNKRRTGGRHGLATAFAEIEEAKPLRASTRQLVTECDWLKRCLKARNPWDKLTYLLIGADRIVNRYSNLPIALSEAQVGATISKVFSQAKTALTSPAGNRCPYSPHVLNLTAAELWQNLCKHYHVCLQHPTEWRRIRNPPTNVYAITAPNSTASPEDFITDLTPREANDLTEQSHVEAVNKQAASRFGWMK